MYKILATLMLLGTSIRVFGLTLIGGIDDGNPYAALVSSTGVTTALTGAALPTGSGMIDSVAIASSGAGIIGGQDNTNETYVALVSSAGVTTALSGAALPGTFGRIFAVAINDSGAGIIGGFSGTFVPYVALVSPTGVTTALSGAITPVGSGLISVAAINNLGAGIIGGTHLGGIVPYVALVSSTGVTTPLTGGVLPTGTGVILNVGINSSGAGIVGGRDTGSVAPYVALVSPAGVTTALTGGALPIGNGEVRAVAINDSGESIIGGAENGNTTPYAALVSPTGVTTALTGAALPTGTGRIRSVAINSSGEAIMGGQDNGNAAPYVALVSPTGVTTALTGAALPTGDGFINSVTINDTGIAIIGGLDNMSTTPYVALVSPTGVTTALSGSALPIGGGSISSVGIIFPEVSESILTAIVPSSFGGGNSFANSIFALTSQVLPNHYGYQHKASYNQASNSPNFDQEIGLLADASDVIRHKIPCNKDANYSLWVAGFGDYVRQQKTGGFPKITNWIGGAMLGFDYRGFENGVIGFGAAYAYNYANLSGNQGNTKTHQEFLTIYGSWNRKYLFINAALWGGLYQSRNTRRAMGMTSRANIDGWLLTPHLEISTPFYGKEPWFVVEPFAMFDWANNWQDSFKETGPSGFNLVVGNQYTSLLRSEVGLRFYQSLGYQWGSVILQEKASWVNKKPFNANSTHVAFTGSVSSFGIEIFSNQTQNLGAVQFSTQFIPCKKKYPYGAINYQGEFGSAFQSHFFSIEIGKNF